MTEEGNLDVAKYVLKWRVVDRELFKRLPSTAFPVCVHNSSTDSIQYYANKFTGPRTYNFRNNLNHCKLILDTMIGAGFDPTISRINIGGLDDWQCSLARGDNVVPCNHKHLEQAIISSCVRAQRSYFG